MKLYKPSTTIFHIHCLEAFCIYESDRYPQIHLTYFYCPRFISQGKLFFFEKHERKSFTESKCHTYDIISLILLPDDNTSKIPKEQSCLISLLDSVPFAGKVLPAPTIFLLRRNSNFGPLYL